MKNLRASIVRLAHDLPKFRSELLGVLKTAGADPTENMSPEAKAKWEANKGKIEDIAKKAGKDPTDSMSPEAKAKWEANKGKIEDIAKKAADGPTYQLKLNPAQKALLAMVAKKMPNPLVAAAFCVHLLDVLGATAEAVKIDKILAQKKGDLKKAEPEADKTASAPAVKTAGFVFHYPMAFKTLMGVVAAKLPNPLTVAAFVVYLLETKGYHDQAVLVDRLFTREKSDFVALGNVEPAATVLASTDTNVKTAGFTLRFPMAFKALLALVAKKLTTPMLVASFCVHLMETTGAHDQAVLLDRLLTKEKSDLMKAGVPAVI